MGSEIGDDLPLGATPLSDDEQEGLIPSIQTRGELNEVEASNIDAATAWALGRGRRTAQREVVTVAGLLELHRRMFDQTWKWAGRIRLSDKNIGVPKEQIREQLRALSDDIQYQLEHQTYPPDELAVRFHHRLVSIHVFPNGNGRHARLAADVLISRLGQTPFSWGGSTLVTASGSRTDYIRALREADGGNISSLLRFARAQGSQAIDKTKPNTRMTKI